MLHIAFTILKIIGIILLTILGILVLLICIVLFTPLRYEITAKADGTMDSIKAKVKFSWFLHVLSGQVCYEEKQADFQVRLLGRKVDLDSLSKKEKSKETTKGTVEETVEETVNEETSVPQNEEEVLQSEKIENKIADKTEPKEKKKGTKKKKKQNVLERIKYTIQSICDKIKALKQKLDEVTEFIKDETHRAAFRRLLKEMHRLLHFLKPKKFHLNMEFGFEDPAQTGQVLGVISMLYPFFEKNIDVTPDFQNQVLKGNVFIKGHFRGIYFIILGFNLLFDRNIRTTFKNIKKFMANI